MHGRSGLIVLLVTLFLAVCVVSADPVELHARREVERRQLADNTTITTSTSSSSTSIVTSITSSSSKTTTHTTTPSTSSNTPTTSDTSTTQTSSSSSPTTTDTTSSSSSSTVSSTSYTTSSYESISTFTTNVVTTINGVATTVASTGTSSTMVATIVPGLQSNVGTTGLSTTNKNIVIGVVVGIGGAAILALIAVIIWRHMRKENEAKAAAHTSNLTYYSDDPAEGYGREPSDGVVGNKEGGEFRSPAVNSAANF